MACTRDMRVRELIAAAILATFASAHGAPAPVAASAPSASVSQTKPASYAERIRAAVLPHLVLPSDVEGNPVAEVQVSTRPDGEVMDVELLRASGSESWDTAVRRAVLKAGRIPLDADGKVPAVFIMNFRPRP